MQTTEAVPKITKRLIPKIDEFVINLLPNTSSLGLTTNVLKEYLGMLIYGLRGWL